MNILNDQLHEKHQEWLKKLRAKELAEKELQRQKSQPPVRTPMSAEDLEEIRKAREERTYIDQNYETVPLVKNEYSGVEPEAYKGLNPFTKGDSFNLTVQGEITASNPKLAKFLKAEALKDGKWHRTYKVDRMSKPSTKEKARIEKIMGK